MKKVERRSLWFAGLAMCLAVAYAAVAPLGCGGGCADAAEDCGVGGSGGAGATGGSAGAGQTGGTAGAAGSAGTAGAAGSAGGTSPDSGGAICGGFAGLKCPESMFCDYPANFCGEGDMYTGECTPRPDVCPKDCPGACGCDGKFYCNVCEGQRAGTDARMGACPEAGPLQFPR